MVDPHDGYVSFQEALLAGTINVVETSSGSGVFAHFDEPAKGVSRLTYVRLGEDRCTVTAFVAAVLNGRVGQHICVALGYAVPERFRNEGRASELVSFVIRDSAKQAGRLGHKKIYVEAVIDVENAASIRVAEKTFAVEPEKIIDRASKKPAYRYTIEISTNP